MYKVTNNIVVGGVAKSLLEDVSYLSPGSAFLRTKMAAMRGRRGDGPPQKRVFVPWGVPFTKAMRRVFGKALKSPFKELELPESKKKLNYEE